MDDVARPEQAIDVEQNEGCSLRDGACSGRDAGEHPCGECCFKDAEGLDERPSEGVEAWNGGDDLDLRWRAAEQLAPQTFIEPDRRNGSADDSYGWKRDGNVMQWCLLATRYTRSATS